MSHEKRLVESKLVLPAAVGKAALPSGIAVEVEALFEVD